MRPSPFLLLLAVLCTACASKAPEPQPDPAEIRRLMSQLEGCGTTCGQPSAPDKAGPALPDNVAAKVQAADRLVPALEKMPTEHLDPSLAAALIEG